MLLRDIIHQHARPLATMATDWSIQGLDGATRFEHAHWVMVLLGACAGLHADVRPVFDLYLQQHGAKSVEHAKYARRLAHRHRAIDNGSVTAVGVEWTDIVPPKKDVGWHALTTEITNHCIQQRTTGIYHRTWSMVDAHIVAAKVAIDRRGYCTKPHMLYFVTHYIFVVADYGVGCFTGASLKVKSDLVKLCTKWIDVLMARPKRNLELLCELFTSLLCLGEPHSKTCDFALWVMNNGRKCTNGRLGTIGGFYMHHIPRVDKVYEHLHTLFVVLLFICKVHPFT